jgi:hypothetical protein
MRTRPTPFLRRIRTRASLSLTRPPFRVSLALAALSVLVAGAPISADSSPTASYTITGLTGANGWYRGSAGGNYVVLHWDVQNTSQIDHTVGCEAATRIDGPSTGTTRTCTAFLMGGGSVSWTTNVIKIDADPPSGLSASVARGPDANRWYNHPVQINWSGADGTSGIAACTSLTYGGPDASAASVTGGCTDNAGNTALDPIAVNYDATPPALSKVAVTSDAAADIVHWSSSSATDTVVVRRSARGNRSQQTIFRGTAASFTDKRIRSGLEYTYSVQAYDQADNASPTISVVALPKVLTLRKTSYIPRAARNPVLRWKAVRGAGYYHVQLFRGRKRILAAWPSGSQLGLPASWTWSGHRYRLNPGRYRWYVWVGLGQRSFARYKTLGSAEFMVLRR